MNARDVTSVLIVDDSAMVRKVLSLGFEADPAFRVVGTARNVAIAEELLDEVKPDVITLDIEMPEVDGLTWLCGLMKTRPLPVVIVTSLGRAGGEVTMAAMECGAVDVIDKPMLGAGSGLGPIMEEVKARVKAASRANPSPITPRLRQRAVSPKPVWPTWSGQKIMALGSSTGGVQALARILPMFPANSPGILIVQHMPEGFTAAFAKRLDGLCAMDVSEAKDGDLVQDGQILIAPGGVRHLKVEQIGKLFRTVLTEDAPVCFSRPSIDVLMKSLANCVGRNSVGALLTGMGRDGAAGLKSIREAGGLTIAQDAATSVVYGMPAAAAENGGAAHILPLDDIPEMMLREMSNRQVRTDGPINPLNSQRPLRHSSS